MARGKSGDAIMARGKSGDAATMRMFNSSTLKNISLNLAGKQPGQSVQSIQQAIDRNWESMPQQAKTFLLEIETLELSFHKLAKFWSSPSVIEYTRGGIAGKSVCGGKFAARGSIPFIRVIIVSNTNLFLLDASS
jgi:hypothetical protein